MEEPGRLHGAAKSWTTKRVHTHTHTHTHVYMWLTHFAVQQKLTQHTRTHAHAHTHARVADSLCCTAETDTAV